MQKRGDATSLVHAHFHHERVDEQPQSGFRDETLLADGGGVERASSGPGGGESTTTLSIRLQVGFIYPVASGMVQQTVELPITGRPAGRDGAQNQPRVALRMHADQHLGAWR